jgi:hypothetical protein
METKLKLSSEVERPGATINLMLDVDPDSRHFGIDTAGRTYHRRDRARRAFALHVPGTDQIVKTANAIQSTIATGAKHLVHAGGDTSTTTSEGHDGVRFVNIRRDTIPPDEHGFLARLALKLERRVYAPKEALVPEDLQIVIKVTSARTLSRMLASIAACHPPFVVAACAWLQAWLTAAAAARLPGVSGLRRCS